jgi:hypothetical protein
MNVTLLSLSKAEFMFPIDYPDTSGETSFAEFILDLAPTV